MTTSASQLAPRQLTCEEMEVIRDYVWTKCAPVGIALTILSFFLGYYFKEAAAVVAYEKFTESLVETSGTIAEAKVAATNARYDAEKARNDADQLKTEIEARLKAINEAVGKAKPEEIVADLLKKDPEFSRLLVEKADDRLKGLENRINSVLLENGDVKITGNLNVAGKVESKDVAATRSILVGIGGTGVYFYMPDGQSDNISMVMGHGGVKPAKDPQIRYDVPKFFLRLNKGKFEKPNL